MAEKNSEECGAPPYDAMALSEIRLVREEKLMFKQMSFVKRQTTRSKEFLRRCVSELRTVGMLLLTLATLVVCWRLTVHLTNCESTLVVVLSGSMEPAFYRGDLLILHKRSSIEASDIVVFNLPGRQVPIVHRVHRVHEDGGRRMYLTKGDNNDFDDRTLYPDGYRWVQESDVTGKVVILIPHAGFLTIAAEENPRVRQVILIAALIWGWMSSL